MAKKRITKFQTYPQINPQLMQFGGLNLPFLDKYTNLNNQWNTFWRSGDYNEKDGNMLKYSLQENNRAIEGNKLVNDYANRTGAKEWGDKALDYSYKNDWNNRNPNATDADKARFENYSNFYNQYDNGKAAPGWNGIPTLEAGAPGSTLGDYNAWKDSRSYIADSAKKQWTSNNMAYKDMNAKAKTAAREAMTNTGAGIFSGFNYMNAYTPPEEINLQQGSKGVMYSQYGNTVPLMQNGELIKGPGMMYSPMMKEFGGVKTPNSKWTHFPNGTSAINALDSMLTSGRSKIYKEDMSLADVMSSYDPRLGNTAGKFSKYTIKDLKKDKQLKDEFLQHIIRNEVTAQDYNQHYEPAFTSRQVGPSLMDYQVTSRQDGGNVNMTGYTPGYESMEAPMNEIPSGDITMEQTPIPLLAIGKGGADNGLLKVLQANSKGYNFKSKSTVEIPLEQQNQEQQMAPMANYGKQINYNPLYGQFGLNVAGALQSAAAQVPGLQNAQAAYLNELSGGQYINASPEFNQRMLQGYNQTQAQPQSANISMLPTINPSIVEPMSGLGFNRDKMSAEMSINSGIRLKKGGTQKVAAYQQMLREKGYNIDVDGAWGPDTQAAYEAYTGKKAPSKTAVNSGKAKVAGNIIKRDSGEGYLNNPAMRGIVEKEKQNNNFTPKPSNYKRGIRNDYAFFASNDNIKDFNNTSKEYKFKKEKDFNSYLEQLGKSIDRKLITPYEAMRLQKLAEKKGYYIPNKQYGGTIPKFQFGGSVNDQHAVPIFSSNLEEFGLTELQTEKDEVAFMPDGSVVDVKAKELHKKQDKHNVSDIMQSGTYVFSNDPKMKFGIKSKLGGVELGDMKLGKSVFKYVENEITPGPEDIMLKDMFFNGSKKELTTADIAKNVKKNLPIVDMKNDYFADRAIAENKDQRLEYLSILKAFNEYKKPKQKSIPKAQYGMPIQPTQNGFDGVMGYGKNFMDPFKKADNNMVSMFNYKQPGLPEIPKAYENGGEVEQAQLGKLLRYTVPGALPISEYFANKAKKKQERANAILSAEAQGYRDNLQQGVDRSGALGIGTNMATYAASLNVPLQKYDDQSEQMAMYNAAATRANQRLEASKYTASQGIGGASSLARYNNPSSYGDYLAKVQSQSDGNIGRINQAIADLDMQRANQNVQFMSTRNAGRNQALNARDTQLYNANIQGIGNVGKSTQEATFNSADTRYRMGTEKMAYDAYLTDKAQGAKDRVIQGWEGSLDALGQIGLTAATGGFGGGKLFDKQTPTSNTPNSYNFNGDPNSFSFQNGKQQYQQSPANNQYAMPILPFTIYEKLYTPSNMYMQNQPPQGMINRSGGQAFWNPTTNTWGQ